jgi:hypothetical protein
MDQLIGPEYCPMQRAGIVELEASVELGFEPVGMIMDDEFAEYQGGDQLRRVGNRQKCRNGSYRVNSRMRETRRVKVIALARDHAVWLQDKIGKEMFNEKDKHRRQEQGHSGTTSGGRGRAGVEVGEFAALQSRLGRDPVNYSKDVEFRPA